LVLRMFFDLRRFLRARSHFYGSGLRMALADGASHS